MADDDPSFVTRLALAFACLFRLLFDVRFAADVQRLRAGETLLAPGPEPGTSASAASASEPRPSDADVSPPSAAVESAAVIPEVPGALVLLGVLQREGRLIDFLEQDIADFDDEAIGAAARQVHQGCRSALRSHGSLSPLREEPENSPIEVESGYSASEVKLTGNVVGEGPYRGKLIHRGWRLQALALPQVMAGHDATVLAPAEVEIS